MWKSRRLFGEISKGFVERVGSLLFGFPRFPQPRHFHGSVPIRRGLSSGYPCPASFFRLLFFSR